MTVQSTKMIGGCLCGAIRFEIRVLTEDVVDYCHCGQCRKASGAPISAWVQVAPVRFRVTKGIARSYRSSVRATRWFCGACGSSLHMTDPDDRSVGIPLGALDDAGSLRPTVHGWVSSRLGWLTLHDDLPRYDEDPPYDL